MEIGLISAAIALVMAVLMLWLRYVVLTFGKKRPPYSSDAATRQRNIILFEQSEDLATGEDLSMDLIDYQATASPIQVEEFLAELRAQVAGNRPHSETGKNGSPA
jgi:hypothetical protein